MARHTSRHGVDGKGHVLAFLFKFRHELFHGRLRLRQRHAVARYNDDALGVAQPGARLEFGGHRFSGRGNFIRSITFPVGAHDRAEGFFRVTQHQRDMLFSSVIEGVIDTGVTRPCVVVAHDEAFRVFDIQDGHAVDRCAFGRIRSRVHNIVGADHNDDIGVFEILIDVLHLIQFVVGDVDFRQQHIHMTRHTPRDGVDGKLDLFPVSFKLSHELLHGRLRLRQCHAVARHNDDALGVAQPAAAAHFG